MELLDKWYVNVLIFFGIIAMPAWMWIGLALILIALKVGLNIADKYFVKGR